MNAAAVAVEQAECHRAIELYYRLRKLEPLRQQRNALPDMARFLQWCREKKVDPERFMRFRFEQIAKPIGIASLRSEKSLAAFREWGDDESVATQHGEQLTARAFTADEDRIVALSYPPSRAQERLRADYLAQGQVEACRVERRFTGGYDPRSQHCPRCPGKHLCLLEQNKQHGFDVGALRIGMLQRLPEHVVKTIRKKR